MKAIIKQSDGVFLKEVPIPGIIATDVLIRVAIVAYCRTDGYVAQDKIKTKTPLILGHEFSGIIESVGEEVIKFKKDDRVAIMPVLPDEKGYYLGPMLGVDRDGAFAEYVSVPEVAVYKIPDSMSFVEAAYLEPVAASLAILKMPLEKNQKGFILGKNRISNLTKRILDLYGFNSIDIVPIEKMQNVTDDSYDFAIETIATAATLAQLVRVVRPGGAIILKSRQYVPVEINVKKIVQKDLRLLGTQYGDFQKGLDLLASGQLKVNDMFETLDLEDAVDVLKGEPNRYEDKKLFFNTHLCAE
jgi:threonine dehydrogenase-like Zn-dependent dehydrogenase